MFDKLGKLESEFARNLLFSLKCHIIERRNQVTSTLMAYLESPRFLQTTSGKHFPYSDREEIAKDATRLLIRLFSTPEPEIEAHDDENIDEPEIVEEETAPTMSESDSDAMAPTRSDSDDFKDVLEPKPEPAVIRSEKTIDIDTIKEHMSAFESSGERSSLLQKVGAKAGKI